ncbi:MAG TPA: Fic/DOC family N-terminal domain-containing protein [Terracidiphilus sp.]|nr:Fic/DOC family N-terminal domain-containing protein [Terracidiphilus sp.]
MHPFSPQKLPIKVDWEPLIPLIGKANRALAQYDGVLYGLPNPEVLFSPMTTQEAVLSSRIEGTQATLGEVLKFEAGEEPQQESKRLDIQEIINYRIAMTTAETRLKVRPFNLNLLLELHGILLDSVRGRNKARGQFRRIQNWIGASGSSIESADFVPPSPEVLFDYLDNWEKYYHAEQPDPLVQLAIVHAQFEILHPFLDGNGRLGRLIIPLFLSEKKVLSRPMFYLSSYLDREREAYIARLRELGKDDEAWNRWIEFFLNALIYQAGEDSRKARSILDLYEKLKCRVIGLTHSQFAVPVLDRMFERPLFQSSTIQGIPNSPSKQAVSILLNRLKEADILRVIREKSGRRPQVFALWELLNLCEGREVF